MPGDILSGYETKDTFPSVTTTVQLKAPSDTGLKTSGLPSLNPSKSELRANMADFRERAAEAFADSAWNQLRSLPGSAGFSAREWKSQTDYYLNDTLPKYLDTLPQYQNNPQAKEDFLFDMDMRVRERLDRDVLQPIKKASTFDAYTKMLGAGIDNFIKSAATLALPAWDRFNDATDDEKVKTARYLKNMTEEYNRADEQRRAENPLYKDLYDEANEDNMVDRDFLAGVWKSDHTVSRIANLVISQGPQVATSIIAAMGAAMLAPLVGAGAGVTALVSGAMLAGTNAFMGMGEVAQNIFQDISEAPREELLGVPEFKQSYENYLKQGDDDELAYDKATLLLAVNASRELSVGHAIPLAILGLLGPEAQITQKGIIDPLLRHGIFKRSLAARATARVGIGATAEGLDEVAEGATANYAVSKTLGRDITMESLFEGGLNNFEAGALAGGILGGVGNVNEARRQGRPSQQTAAEASAEAASQGGEDINADGDVADAAEQGGEDINASGDLTDSIVQGQADETARRAAAEQSLKWLDDYFEVFVKNDQTTADATRFDDDTTIELASHIKNIRDGAPVGTIEDYFTMLTRATSGRVQVDPQVVTERAAQIEAARSGNTGTGDTGSGITEKIINDAIEHRRQVSTHSGGLRGYMRDISRPGGKNAYTGIDTQTGETFSVHLGDLSISRGLDKLAKDLDPKSEADVADFTLRTEEEYKARGMTRAAAELAARAAARVWSTTGKAHATEIKRALFELGETDWQTVADMEVNNANNTTGGRGTGQQPGQTTGPGQTGPSQTGPQNSSSTSGSSSSTQSGGSRGNSHADAREAAPSVQPAQPAEGASGGNSVGGPGNTESAPGNASADTGTGGTAGETEQRTGDNGSAETTNGPAQPGLDNRSLDQVLSRLGFYEFAPREMTAFRGLVNNAMASMAAAYNRSNPDELSPDVRRAFMVAAVTYARIQMYIAQLCNWNASEIIQNATSVVARRLSNSYGTSNADIPLITIDSNPRADGVAGITRTMIHETAHALLTQAVLNKNTIEQTAQGREFLDALRSIAEACGVKPSGNTDILEQFNRPSRAGERFAIALESYFITGNIPSTFGNLANDPAVRGVFSQLLAMVRQTIGHVYTLLWDAFYALANIDARAADDFAFRSSDNMDLTLTSLENYYGQTASNKPNPITDYFKNYEFTRAAYTIEGKIPPQITALFNQLLGDASLAAYQFEGMENTAPEILGELAHAEIVLAERFISAGYDTTEAMNMAHEQVAMKVKEVLASPEQRAETARQSREDSLAAANVEMNGALDEALTNENSAGIELDTDEATAETLEQGLVPPGADPEGGIETSHPADPEVNNAPADEATDTDARVSLTEEITEALDESVQTDTGTDQRRWINGDVAQRFISTGPVVRDANGRPMVMSMDVHSGVITETATDFAADTSMETLVAEPVNVKESDYNTNEVLKDLSQAEDIVHLQKIAAAILAKHENSTAMRILTDIYGASTVRITCKNGETALVALNDNGVSYAAMELAEADDAAETEGSANVNALRQRPPGTPPNTNPASVQQAMQNAAQIIRRRARTHRTARQTAATRRNTERAIRGSYSYTQAQEAGWWQRFARWMRRAWDSKSDLYMWNILNNSPTMGEAWSSPLNNAIQTTGARVDGARTELTSRFIDPLNDWARTKVKDLGLAPEKWSEFIHDMGLARTLLHTIESSAWRRNQLQDALLQAYTQPYGPARTKAVRDAQNAIHRYNQKQANKQVQNGIYLDGGRTEAECIALFNDIVAEYGQQVTEEGVERIGQSVEGLVQHLIEQNVMSESDVAKFRQFGYYVPLMTQADVRRNDDVSELVASPDLLLGREGSEAAAVDGMSTLEKYINRAANALGARDLGTELQSTYQRLAQAHAKGDPNVVKASSTLFHKDDIIYYNGLAMCRKSLLQGASLAQGQTQMAIHIRNNANHILNNKHIVVRIVEDTDEQGNPKIPETVPYVVWFNHDTMNGTNGAGKQVTVNNNTKVNEALHSIYANNPPSGLNKAGRNITRFYGSLVTTFKPSFSVYNAQADFMERLAYTASRTYTALTNGKRHEVSGVKIAASMSAYAANPALMLKLARYAWNMNTSGLKGRERALMEEFKKSGIMSSASIQQYLQRQGDTAYAFLMNNDLTDKNALQKLGEKGVVPFRKWADLWYTLAPAVEYMAMRKHGLSESDARAAVLEQMNMRTKGSIDTMFGWALPFIPSIGQTAMNFTAMLGLNATTFGHSRSRQTRAKAYKVWASMGALSIGITALLPLLAAAFGDGDEDKGWKILDSMDLSGIDSIVLPGDEGEMVKVMRVGFGPGRFVTQAAFAMSRLSRGTAEIDDVMKTMATSYMVNVSPFSNPVFDVHNMNDLGQKFAMMMTPAFLRPVAESFVYNRDFFGSTVVKNATWATPEARHSDSRDRATPRVWSAMAQNLYEATGGMFDVYPEQLRNMAKGWMIGPFQAVYKWIDDDPLVKDPAWREHRDIIGVPLTLLGASSFYYKYNDVNQRFFYQTDQLMNEIIQKNGLAVAMKGKGPYDKTNRDKQDRVLRQAGFPPSMVRDHRILKDTYVTLQAMDKEYRQFVDKAIAGRKMSEARMDAICHQHYAKRARILEQAVKSLNIYKDPSLRSVYLDGGIADNIKRVRARGFMEKAEL